MRRLVYSPKVQAWINSTEGVVDVSPYIVSGQINRKVNQVSTASLVLRNPVQQNGEYVGTLFTEFPRADGTTGPLFHPMDPIIITMQRLEGHPVQVFTGYLDKSPYLQFYPGLCQVEASCTLKRLLYTQWDAALPFVQYFLTQFGWVPDGNTGIVNPTAEADQLKTFAGQIQNKFNDGSLGSLIYAILLYIGQWDASTIFIEELPQNVKDYVVSLFNRIQVDVGSDETIFQSLIQQILGIGSQGGGLPTSNGGGGTVNSPLLNAKQNSFASTLSQATGLDPNVVAAWVLAEEPKSAATAPNGANNWLNVGDTGSGNYGGSANVWSSPTSAGSFTAQWISGKSLAGYGTASSGIQGILNTVGKSPQTQISAIQNSGWAASHYPSLPADYSEIVKAGGQTVKSGKNANSASSSFTPTGPGRLAGTSPAATTSQGNSTQPASVSGTSPGGKKGKAQGSGGGTSYLATIFPAGTKVVLERTDMGVDFAVPDGTPIGAMASGTVSLTTSNGFAGQPLLMVKFDQPINGNKAWYISEGIKPTKTSGHVDAGEQIGVIQNHGTGIEMGWSDPSTGYPVADSYYHEGMRTRDGINFANTIGVPALPSGQSQGMKVTGTGFTGSSATVSSGSGGNSATAAAFSTMINLPSIFQTAEAIAFTGKRSFIADSPLFPFIEQLCQASLRNFMSMPNGNFFAFFPDYFGLFGRNPYWEVRDLEIMDGRIDLSDDPLATHVAVAGDVTQFHGTVDVFDLLLTAGIFDIFDAFALGYVNGPDSLVQADLNIPNKILNGKQRTETKQQALDFLQKYGARTYVEEVPAIRSPFFELFYSFMKFMLMWSKQFMTTFEITFMPELFPGGLVAFPDHNLQLYVEEVVHSFDYTNGFTTTANFSSPAAFDGVGKARPNLREGLTRLNNLQFTPVPNPLDAKPKTDTKTKAKK